MDLVVDSELLMDTIRFLKFSVHQLSRAFASREQITFEEAAGILYREWPQAGGNLEHIAGFLNDRLLPHASEDDIDSIIVRYPSCARIDTSVLKGMGTRVVVFGIGIRDSLKHYGTEFKTNYFGTENGRLHLYTPVTLENRAELEQHGLKRESLYIGFDNPGFVYGLEPKKGYEREARRIINAAKQERR